MTLGPTEKLRTIWHNRQLGPFFKHGGLAARSWQFFNPEVRNWESVKQSYQNQSQFLVLRDGWIIRRIGRRTDPHDYYLCREGRLEPLNRAEAEVAAYETSPGFANMACSERGGRLYLHSGPIYLPIRHFIALKALALPVPRRNGLQEVMVFDGNRRTQVEELLTMLRIRLTQRDDFVGPTPALSSEEQEAYRQLLRTASQIFEKAYSDYLKREDRIEGFILDLVHRNWNRIPSKGLRGLLRVLVERMDAGDELAVRLYDYIVDKLPAYFSWQDMHDATINGIIVDTIPQEFQGRWSTNYFKIVVPELEAALHWRTTLKPSGRTIGSLVGRLQGVKLERWRIYPYLGKLKNTGDKRQVDFADREADELRKAFYSIVGVPSFELLLREHGYLDGFNLDYREWRGGYSLTRCFLAAARIEEPLKIGAATPTTVVTDVFGNHFGIRWPIDNYCHEAETIHGFRRGGWISILLENEVNALDPDHALPCFPTGEYLASRFITKSDAYRLSAIGIVRYCGLISDRGLRGLGEQTLEPNIFREALDAAYREGVLVRDGDYHFYTHNCVSTENMSQVAHAILRPAEPMSRAILKEIWYKRWSLLRLLFSYVHPLIWAKGLFDNPARNPFPENTHKYEVLRRFVKQELESQTRLRELAQKERLSLLMRSDRSGFKWHETLVGGKHDEQRYIEDATSMLDNFGHARVKARGRFISKAHRVVQKTLQIYAFAMPTSERTDSIEELSGRKIPSVEFNVRGYSVGGDD